MQTLTMRTFTMTGLMMAAAIGAANAQENGPKLETAKDKVSYQIGFQIGNNIKRQGLDIDPKILAEGVAAALAGKKPALTPEEAEAAFAAMDEQLQKERAELAARIWKPARSFWKRTRPRTGLRSRSPDCSTRLSRKEPERLPRRRAPFPLITAAR